MNKLLDYAGADGWASMLKHEWQIPQFPFIRFDKLRTPEPIDLSKYKGATGAQYAYTDAFAKLAIGLLNHKTHDAYA